MAIPVCVVLVSLFLPALSSPSDVKSDNSTTSLSWYARAVLLSAISVDLISDGLIVSQSEQSSSSDSRTIQGNSKSKKKPKEGGD